MIYRFNLEGRGAACHSIEIFVDRIVIRESLTIAGWVAMWRPMQIFLYDWWPLLRKGHLYEKMSRMRVEVRKRG